jgi:hemolysin activation/secretion protein
VLIFGAYAVQRPEVGFLFNSEGHSGQASIRYARRLTGDSPSTSQSLQFGFDYKKADSNLEFLGFRVLDTAVEIAQFPLVYDLTVTDRWGQTDVENTLVLSPGDLTDENTDEALQRLVPFAEARYLYDRISLTRTTFLPGDGSWIVRVLGQVASGNLPYSEQVGAGGIGSVRGYDTNTLLGSEGVLLSQELRTPAFALPPLFGSGAAHQIQFGVFWDYAHLRQKQAFPDLPNGATLSSVGVNLHYSAGRYFNFQVEAGSQLRAAPFNPRKEARLAVVLTAGF